MSWKECHVEDERLRYLRCEHCLTMRTVPKPGDSSSARSCTAHAAVGSASGTMCQTVSPLIHRQTVAVLRSVA